MDKPKPVEKTFDKLFTAVLQITKGKPPAEGWILLHKIEPDVYIWIDMGRFKQFITDNYIPKSEMPKIVGDILTRYLNK